jgi:NAD-dependent dihydropyrimidine dehydrogenase PreA subunit
MTMFGSIKEKSRKNKVIQITDDKCARCRSCILKCHHHVLDMENGEKGMHLIVKYPNECTGCGKCVSACNLSALKLVDRD